MTRQSHLVRSIAVVLVVAGLSACNSTPRRDPEYAASMPAVHANPSAARAASGAIFQAGYELAFFEDLKARRIGDILTITLNETHNAQKSADTDLARTQSSSIDNPTIFGTTPKFNLPGLLPLVSTTSNTLESKLAAEHDFSGGSDSKLSNSLSGSVTVTVADVFPNGNLFVRGEKRLNINQGNEYVKISGVVRPVDVASDNTVVSTKVADATIIYNGDGAVADSNRAGWLTRFFMSAASPF
jgi:flagellar L-ring protein precursor FlgH